MNHSEISSRLVALGSEIDAIAQCASESVRSDFETWKSDLQNDEFLVAVVGEFNKGKSSLLNALFGTNLLPTGITPTTSAVTLVRNSDSPQIVVHFRDGSQRNIDFSEAALRMFVAEGSKSAAPVDHVAIGIQHPLLNDGVIYVDTPGVSDLSTERTEITYGFVPRADAVLFVLDSTHPVSRSEADFLNTAILKEKVENLVFALNFADLLDEDDRLDASDRARNRLSSATNLDAPKVFLVSTRNSDNPSGLRDLADHLHAVTAEGSLRMHKIARMRDRLVRILEAIQHDLAKRRQASELTVAGLREEIEILEQHWGHRNEKANYVREWVQDREIEVIAMTQKSLDTFLENLKEDIQDLVQTYAGPNFKSFVEGQLPIQVKKRYKAWLDRHSDAFRTIIVRLCTDLTNALNREFEAAIPLLEPRLVEFAMEPVALQLGAVGNNWGRVQAGVIAAGVSGALILVGAPFLAPLIPFAALPFLSNELEGEGLKRAKEAFLSGLEHSFEDAARAFRDNVLGFLHAQIAEIGRTAEATYFQLLKDARKLLEAENHIRMHTRSAEQSQAETFESQISRMDELQQQLLSLIPKSIEGVTA